MVRRRPLATVTAALALLACALLFAPIASTQSSPQTLSPTPPVPLAPPSSTRVSTTPTATETSPPSELPKTGLETWRVALAGLVLLTTGAVLRRGRRRRPASRRSR